jgi:hypothetical protein
MAHILTKFKIDLKLVAKGLGLPLTECKRMFSDGRFAGHYIERRLTKKMNWKLSYSKSTPYDAKTVKGKKVEIRCLTDRVMFKPSSQNGVGRKFERKGFYRKLDAIDYYAIVDIHHLVVTGSVEVVMVTSNRIRKLYETNYLGKNAEVGYNSARSLFFS